MSSKRNKRRTKKPKKQTQAKKKDYSPTSGDISELILIMHQTHLKWLGPIEKINFFISKGLFSVEGDLSPVKQKLLGDNVMLASNHNLIFEYCQSNNIESLLKLAMFHELPTNKWYSSDICFCESGKNIWDCHLKELENKVFNFDDLMRNELKQYIFTKPKQISTCLIDGCKEKTINSHIIPNNILKKIANNFEAIDMFEESDINEKFATKRSANQIAEKLFCAKHDSEIFKNVDVAPFEINIHNLKLAAIRGAYYELSAKLIVSNSLKDLFVKNPKFAAMPNLIELFKGNRLGARDIKVNIDDMLQESNQRVIWGIVDTNVEFCSWSLSDIRFYSEDKKKVLDIPIDKKQYDELVFPSICTVAFPFDVGKMIYISVFNSDKALDKEYNYVNQMTEDDRQRWISKMLSDGANFWATPKTKLSLSSYLEKFKIPSEFNFLSGHIPIYEHNYKSVDNIFSKIQIKEGLE